MPTTAPSSNPIVFLVNGAALPGDSTSSGKIRAARVAGVSRSDTKPIRLEAQPGTDTVLLTIGTATNGTHPDLKLYLHPEHARDLLLAQVGEDKQRSENDSGVVQVPSQLVWRAQPDSTRGFVGDLVLKTLELLGVAAQNALARQTARLAGQKLDDQVNEGVYPLKANHLSSLKHSAPIDIPASAEPMLILIHGTFSNTAAGFDKLWKHHPALVQRLFQNYNNRVYALDHATVLRSPIANALTLAQRLPDNARLHLLTHSRGGLVAEVLLRASQGVLAADLDVFKGDDYAIHRQDLRALADLLQRKHITVERIVRVACPAHGTLLASNRLDAYLSALSWLLGQAGILVLPELIDFTKAVARERADPRSLAGIEAMRSNSALITWLNQRPQTSSNQLRVVAGDLQADSFTSWVKTMLTDLFYWTDHDLVVQTSSMYGGMARKDGALFMLERSGKTDHFSYFKNDETANGAVRALIDAEPSGFTAIGPQSVAGEVSDGVRGGELISQAEDNGSRPAVFVLPGILGSNLQSGTTREWFVWWRLPGFIERIAINQTGISADGPVEQYYQDLMDHLAQSHHVRAFAFDWRLSLEDSAKQLAKKIDAALDLRQQSGMPVRVIAHSMGSMVLRVLQLKHPVIWRKMMDHKDARVLMLGPPNQGSWAPMSIYTGDDSFGQFLSTVGGLFQERKARQTIARFPGLLQLQAGLTDPKWQLRDLQQWKDMAVRDQKATSDLFSWHNSAVQTESYDWALPGAEDLAQAATLRRELDQQAANLQQDSQKISIVLGHAETTPCGIDWDDDGLFYVGTPKGDGRVTWESACLPGVRTWQVECEHGDLPAASAYFVGYTELLERGDTLSLPLFKHAGSRSTEAQAADTQAPLRLMRLRTQSAKEQSNAATPPDQKRLLAAALGSGHFSSMGRASPGRTAPLQIEVLHGDLRFIDEVLMLGHSRSLKLTGSEHLANRLLGNALQEALDLHLYPEERGQHQLFINRHQAPNSPALQPKPPAVMIVGMGDEGDLQPNQLRDAVRQATLAVQLHHKCDDKSTTLTLASTSLGSSGNLSVSQSVTALVHGVMQANARIMASGSTPIWPLVSKLLIVELHKNRALEAWQALHALSESEMQNLNLLPHIRSMDGKRGEPPGGFYRGGAQDRIRINELVSCPEHDQAVQTGQTKANTVTLEFSVQTQRARTEVQGKNTQCSLIDALVLEAESKAAYDVRLARTLFQLLMPHEVKPFLGSTNTLVLEVDDKTAKYPWEMLEDSQSEAQKPWALRISGGLLRKMRVSQFRRRPTDAPGNKVLVVGEPLLDPDQKLTDLPGARAEAEAVHALFGDDSTLLVGENFSRITTTLLPSPWKIVHLAGHGQYAPNGQRSGMVMSNNQLLSQTEFESMETVPELVFINCCHLGKIASDSLRNRAMFAANVAEQLILIGVRCVVAAGWAVDDDAAKVFATTFYKVLLKNAPFAEAVRQAREAAWKKNPASNTWAAYQCYGDPAWCLNRSGGSSESAGRFSKTPGLPSENELLFELETVRAEANSADGVLSKELCDYLNKLIAAALPEWLNQGKVAEAIGLTWRDLAKKDQALIWLESAVLAPDGSASLVAREQQLNIKVREAKTTEALELLIPQIEILTRFTPTAERWSILGSAYKRLAILHEGKDQIGLEACLDKMGSSYAEAAARKPLDLHYPLMQQRLAQLRLHWLACAKSDIEATALLSTMDITAIQNALTQQSNKKPDFWSEVGKHEVTLLEGMDKQDLASRMDGIVRGLKDVHLRVSNRHYWNSVNKTAEFMLVHYKEVVKDKPDEVAAADRYLAVVAFG